MLDKNVSWALLFIKCTLTFLKFLSRKLQYKGIKTSTILLFCWGFNFPFFNTNFMKSALILPNKESDTGYINSRVDRMCPIMKQYFLKYHHFCGMVNINFKYKQLIFIFSCKRSCSPDCTTYPLVWACLIWCFI